MKWLGLHVETTMKLKESVIRNGNNLLARMQMNSKEFKHWIFFAETISALSSNLEKKGFNHQAILHAMAVNGEHHVFNNFIVFTT